MKKRIASTQETKLPSKPKKFELKGADSPKSPLKVTVLKSRLIKFDVQVPSRARLYLNTDNLSNKKALDLVKWWADHLTDILVHPNIKARNLRQYGKYLARMLLFFYMKTDYGSVQTKIGKIVDLLKQLELAISQMVKKEAETTECSKSSFQQNLNDLR